MKSIVVGVDGSDPSLRALRVAAELTDDLHDTELVVVFAHYVPLAMPPDVAENMYGDVLDDAEQKIRVAVADVLTGATTPWRFVSRRDEPAAALARLADEVNARFIVVGRQHWSTAHELLMGSIANRLIHHGTRPVLVVT